MSNIWLKEDALHYISQNGYYIKWTGTIMAKSLFVSGTVTAIDNQLEYVDEYQNLRQISFNTTYEILKYDDKFLNIKNNFKELEKFLEFLYAANPKTQNTSLPSHSDHADHHSDYHADGGWRTDFNKS